MDLQKYAEDLPRGGLSALAKKLDISYVYLSQLIAKQDGREPSPELAAAIERETSGAVTCDELKPDVTWVRVKDKEWPHKLGRPCIDVAAERT